MAHFSESDINDAKERVRQMRQRATAYIDEETPTETTHHTENSSPPKSKPSKTQEDKDDSVFEGIKHNPIVPDTDMDDDQSMIILMMILLLTSEGADNMLILALLYLLF